VQIDLFIFDAAPEPFDEHVVDPATVAIHADSDAGFFQHLDPSFTGELRTLIGVEDLGSAVFGQRLLRRIDTEIRTQCVVE